MEIVPKTRLKAPVQFETTIDLKTPRLDKDNNRDSLSSGKELRKTTTPDRLKVPKAFKYPERYTSPTDLMMSPVTKGVLARNRKGDAAVPLNRNYTKRIIAENSPQFMAVEKVPGTPPKTSAQSETEAMKLQTPPLDKENVQDSLSSGNDFHKVSTPDRLKVPKAFKYPERYTSPTDLMMSPVTKGLLARTRRGGVLLPPSINQTKIQDLRIQDMGLFQS